MSLFVVLESPMQMLPDSPSDYYRERECMEFISGIPVEWDETFVVDARIGEYVIIARRNADVRLQASMTAWKSREIEIELDFLDEADYRMEYIRDGENADIRAIDYKKDTRIVNKSSKVKMKLVEGGGWLGRMKKITISH